MFALSLFIGATYAVSSGFVDSCNAIATFWGCNTFLNNDRALCQERGKEMNWVKSPVVDNSLFELFAGDESAKTTTYTPGKFLSVSLRTKKYDSQYRGILLYAIDAADTSADPAKLGKFEFVDAGSLFHSFCPGAVLHAGAELKPYLTTWRYLPPADFTGSIKFLALIKVGPANVGEFYWPNTLILTKAGDAPTVAQKWYEGARNASCTETCRAVDANLDCDAARLDDVNTAAKIESDIAPFVTCKLPRTARCTTQGLTSDNANFCYYNNAAECTAGGIPSAATPTCAAKSNDATIGRRICPCVCKAGATCGGAAPTSTTAPRTSARVTRTATTSSGGNGGTTRAPGTPTSTTTAPPPVCTQKLGCVCGPNGECDSGAECALMGNMGFCKAKSVCTFGELGCPCASGNTCSAALDCKDSLCVRKLDDACPMGNLGCPCTDKCNQPDQMCMKSNGAEAGFCGVMVKNDNVCTVGTLGCPCDAGKCATDNSCMLIGKSEICVDNRVFADEQGTRAADSGASTLVASALVLATSALVVVFTL